MKVNRFNKNKKLEIGDYVICSSYNIGDYKFDDFNKLVDNNIGQIIDIKNDKSIDNKYVVEYDNIPLSLRNGYMDKNYKSAIRFLRSEILYSSKDKYELESVLLTKKFNI